MLQATQVVPGSPVFLEQNQVSQEYQLTQEILGDQESLAVQGVPLRLHRLPLVYLRDRGDRGFRRPPFLHSVQGGLDLLEDL